LHRVLVHWTATPGRGDRDAPRHRRAHQVAVLRLPRMAVQAEEGEVTMTEQEGLFDMVPTPRETGRAVSELRRLHIVGEALLGPITEDLGLVRCIYRARVWSPDPRRAHEITVRYSTPGHRKSAEWEALTMGEVEALAYGWLDEEETLRRYRSEERRVGKEGRLESA